MAYQKVPQEAGDTIALGGMNNKTGKANPTKVEGYYLGARQVDTQNGPAFLHSFDTAKGKIDVWGKTNLNQRLKSVPIGTMTLVTVESEMKKTARGRMYLFDVQYDPENIIEVTSTTEEVADEADDEDIAVEDDVPLADEVTPARATAPKKTTAAPSPADQTRTKALLAKAHV